MAEELADSPLTLRFSQDSTGQETLERAAYVLADQLSATFKPEGPDWVATIHARPNRDLAELAHRFRQEVVDQALRARIAERTDPLRTLVWALAFSRSGLVERSEQ